MMVFLRPTGSPIGQTLGFGPNGSSASLDTAPAFTTIDTGDQVLIERAGALATVPATLFASAVLAAQLQALMVTLPSTPPGGAGQLYLDGGVLAVTPFSASSPVVVQSEYLPLGPQMQALMQSLPTTLPSTAGQLWLDAGVLALS